MPSIPMFMFAAVLLVGTGAFPYELYAPTTHRAVVDRTRTGHPDLGKADVDVHPMEKYRVRVKYLGAHRPIDADRRDILDRWLKVNAGPEFVGMYQEEYLVREEGTDFWVPVQKMIAPAFVKEVAKDQLVDLYVAWFLALKGVPVFVANEFDTERKVPGQEAQRLPPAQARVVDSWLQSHPGYRLAKVEDCGDCARQINAIRTGTGGRSTSVPDYDPYRTEGDFNDDKITDLAVVVVAPTQVAKRFVVLVINGPFASSGTHPPVFTSEPMDLTGSGLFYGPPRPRPYRLLVSGFESEGMLLIPKGNGYVWDQSADD